NRFSSVLRFLIRTRVGRWLWNTLVSRPRVLALHSAPCVSVRTMFALPLALTFWIFVWHGQSSFSRLCIFVPLLPQTLRAFSSTSPVFPLAPVLDCRFFRACAD